MFRKTAVLAPAFLLLLPAFAFGQRGQQPTPPQPQQSNEIVIRGKLVFGNGGPDERVEVRLERTGMQLVQIQYSDSLGNFEFRNIQPAVYYIAVKVDGYEEVRQEVPATFGFGREASVSIFMNRPAVTTVNRTTGADSDNPDTVDFSQLSIPKRARDEYERAVEDSRKGNTESAMKRLEEAIKIAPDFYQAHNNLGVLYQKANRFRDAEKEFRRAREINPKGEQPLINLGSLFLQEAEFRNAEGPGAVGQILDSALDALEEAVRQMPRSVVAHYYLGAANFKSDFYPEAESALNRALELDSTYGPARLTLVNVYLRQRRWPLVLEQLDTYLKQNPNAPDRAAMERMRSQVAKGLESAPQ
jgi:tetratricopeptide (TPR) repeat protein